MACDVHFDYLRANALVLQRRVYELYTAIKPIYDVTDEWILNNTDAYLPSVSSVKVQIEAYESLVIQMLTLSESQKAIKACDLVIPDHLVIPSDGSFVIPSDGSLTF